MQNFGRINIFRVTAVWKCNRATRLSDVAAQLKSSVIKRIMKVSTCDTLFFSEYNCL
jgi:hypothetical protein